MGRESEEVAATKSAVQCGMVNQVNSYRVKFYSRSYAEDVTSVTSGASQGPHSFNLVFVCLFVCLCHAWRYPVSVPYRTVPSNTAGHNIQIGLSNARS